MPIYEYACEKCENEFEAEQRISDPPLKTCPHCRSRKVKRLISRTSFVLKGSGWYSDLYASPKADKADQADKGGKPEKGDKTDKGGDAGGGEKSAAKSKSAGSKDKSSGAASSGGSKAAA